MDSSLPRLGVRKRNAMEGKMTTQQQLDRGREEVARRGPVYGDRPVAEVAVAEVAYIEAMYAQYQYGKGIEA